LWRIVNRERKKCKGINKDIGMEEWEEFREAAVENSRKGNKERRKNKKIREEKIIEEREN